MPLWMRSSRIRVTHPAAIPFLFEGPDCLCMGSGVRGNTFGSRLGCYDLLPWLRPSWTLFPLRAYEGRGRARRTEVLSPSRTPPSLREGSSRMIVLFTGRWRVQEALSKSVGGPTQGWYGWTKSSLVRDDRWSGWRQGTTEGRRMAAELASPRWGSRAPTARPPHPDFLPSPPLGHLQSGNTKRVMKGYSGGRGSMVWTAHSPPGWLLKVRSAAESTFWKEWIAKEVQSIFYQRGEGNPVSLPIVVEGMLGLGLDSSRKPQRDNDWHVIRA